MDARTKEDLAWDVLYELEKIGLLECVTVAQFSNQDIVTAIVRVLNTHFGVER